MVDLLSKKSLLNISMKFSSNIIVCSSTVILPTIQFIKYLESVFGTMKKNFLLVHREILLKLNWRIDFNVFKFKKKYKKSSEL